MAKARTTRTSPAKGRAAPKPRVSRARTQAPKHDDEAIIDIKLRTLRGESISEISEATKISSTSVRRFLGLVKPDPRQKKAAQEELQAKMNKLQATAEERFAKEKK
ncbi:hypothetical protein BCR35DRAFT_301822 [Leucosporidium creatinivorum]|uniref:Uncharacterized protein n=1 Tax=Leucosporidium creatinivorum TaxID=106004 RepID=A0A1Y2FWD8_9BASI|nr:hypothetical protein BCR35DRAFT_301822 [Leucosporidium creatinivorum]